MHRYSARYAMTAPVFNCPVLRIFADVIGLFPQMIIVSLSSILLLVGISIKHMGTR